MSIQKLSAINLSNKRVLIREDFNVPVQNGIITSDARIRAALPTIEYALNQNAKVIVMSHLGRPTEGEFNPEFSLAPVADCLSHLLHRPVKFITPFGKGGRSPQASGGIFEDNIELNPGEIVLLENVRMLKGEKKNDPELAKKMAGLCDVFVMDAFATAHRAEASTCGVAQFAPQACAGLLLAAEIEALEKALAKPARPLIAIIGGSKISTKLTVLENLLTKVDQLIVGGGIANTFLAAAGFEIGKSLCETDLIPVAQQLLKSGKIPLPTDVVVANEFSAQARAETKSIKNIAAHDMVLDIGPETAQHYAALLKTAGTILWNGPVGVFEFPAFSAGTKTIADAIANSKAFSIAGGGDTLAAIEQFGVGDKISYISTGGGAFLEFVEGKKLPAIKVLEEKC